ncbi:hypothetical protein [Pseudonocardia phyllosphaerae]|uniref:hypothetical protein n=1 Tax=Pseudonocardia phyllosphaerae TaxID=3390502 RepID=UPI00397E5D49
MNGALDRSLKAAVLIAATSLTAVLGAGAANAAPAASEPTPPGPVQGLHLDSRGGEGARVAYFDAGWKAPADTGGGKNLHYAYDVRDTTGRKIDAGQTDATAAGRFDADRCTQPYTIKVHAVTEKPNGSVLVGPETSATFGSLTCEINSSLAAKQTGPGTVHVDIKREAPWDPEVGGPGVLTADGQKVWSGSVGGAEDEEATISGLKPGTHHLKLTTRSPNGHDYVATTDVTVK